MARRQYYDFKGYYYYHLMDILVDSYVTNKRKCIFNVTRQHWMTRIPVGLHPNLY